MTAQQAVKPLLFFKDLVTKAGEYFSAEAAVAGIRVEIDKHFPGYGTAGYYDVEHFKAEQVGSNQHAKQVAGVRALLARWGLHVVEGVVKVPGDPPAPAAEAHEQEVSRIVKAIKVQRDSCGAGLARAVEKVAKREGAALFETEAQQVFTSTPAKGSEWEASDGSVYSEGELRALAELIITAKDRTKAAVRHEPSSGLADSGERVRYDGGGQREPQEGRGDFSLLPFEAMRDLAVHFEKGAKKYEAFNYRKGIPFCRFVSGAVRHLLQFAAGMNDEDHLAAAGCNVVMLLQMRADVAAGRLPASLDDRFVPPAGAP